MPIDISPLTPTQLLGNFAERNQQTLQDVSVQIASNLKHQDYAGYANDGTLERLLSLDSTIAHLNAYKSSNNLAATRAKTARDSIDQIQNVANEFAKNITNRRNSASGDTIPLNLIGSGALDRIAAALNVQFDGRYLFAGSKIDIKPVQSIHSTNVDSSTLDVNTSYYHGDTAAPSVLSNEGQEVTYGITADEDGFKKIIAAVHLAIEGHNENDDGKLSDAMDMINDAVSDLASLRGTATLNINQLEENSKTVDDATNTITENKKDIAATDIVAATTQMAEQQANLQALYLALDRITKLTLSNFLS